MDKSRRSAEVGIPAGLQGLDWSSGNVRRQDNPVTLSLERRHSHKEDRRLSKFSGVPY